MAAQTTLKITNRSGAEVKVHLTLGAVPGCVQDVNAVPLVTAVVNRLQGWFLLPDGATKTYAPPQGQGISGNFAFGSPPLNCPTDEYRNGINLAEFILNNSFQGPGAQETIDISCVAGANAVIAFAMSGGGGWNAGHSQPAVSQFANKPLKQNMGLVGVFPADATIARRGRIRLSPAALRLHPRPLMRIASRSRSAMCSATPQTRAATSK